MNSHGELLTEADVDSPFSASSISITFRKRPSIPPTVCRQMPFILCHYNFSEGYIYLSMQHNNIKFSKYLKSLLTYLIYTNITSPGKKTKAA